MGLALSAADLAVSRAGASVLGELPAFALPSVLVPYPHAWRYQATNAEHMRQQGAAVILQDADLPGDLLRVVTDLLRSPDRLAEMSRRSGALAAPGAAQALASEIERLAAGRD
jgi:UDP-N-acetylglucosamine--N-acetylmuramyl-(pentapeptide) pyrophosphoryl-undecaprenol N-acetylglucosamine transferase